MKTPILYCSFCDKDQFDVECLIAGPSVFVCDECVDLCAEIVAERRRDALPFDGYGKRMKEAMRPTDDTTASQPPNP